MTDLSHDESESRLVPVRKNALQRAAAARLIARGLQQARWEVKTIFSGVRPSVGLSATGQIGTYAARITSAWDSIEIYNVERAGGLTTISVEAVGVEAVPTFAFRWKPQGEYFAVVINGKREGQATLELFDVVKSKHILSIPLSPGSPCGVAWSAWGEYLAVSSMFGSIQLWHFREGRLAEVEHSPLSAAHLLGCRSLAFSPGEGMLAAVAEVTVGEKEDRVPNLFGAADEILVLDVPGFRPIYRMEAPDTVLDLSWGQRGLVACCTRGKIFLITPRTGEVRPLSFHAGACCCHPTQDVCALADRDRIFIVELTTQSILAEQPIDEAEFESLDMCWSNDGDRLLAVSCLGRAYIYRLS